MHKIKVFQMTTNVVISVLILHIVLHIILHIEDDPHASCKLKGIPKRRQEIQAKWDSGSEYSNNSIMNHNV